MKPNAEMKQAIANHGSAEIIMETNSNRTPIVHLLSQSLAFWFCHSERHEWLYVLRVAGRIKSDDAN